MAIDSFDDYIGHSTNLINDHKSADGHPELYFNFNDELFDPSDQSM